MSSRTEAVEWVETTEEVVIIESCLPPDSIAPTVIPVLQAADTPIQKLLDAVDGPGSGDGFYCEECVPLFQEHSDQSKLNGPSFVLDFPTSMGVPQRSLLTLPYGLMIGRSSIPNAGVGIINHGPVVAPGTHFGPYEGEETTVENALASAFSWEIYKGQDNYDYVDAARESLSNWMRYVNCARNKDETNLLAVQYKSSILFHCCRNINPGDELLVWPSSKLLSHFSEAWTQMWSMKLKAAESISSATPQVFLCSRRQLSFTPEAFLQRHTQQTQLIDDRHTPAAELGNPASTAESGLTAASVTEVSVDPAKSKTCSDCGKTFKQIPHLRRHKLSVHSNRRPYCCPQCRRSFSQASGLIRHQLVHRKHTAPKADDRGDDDDDVTLTSEGCNPADEAGSEETGADSSNVPEEEPSNNCCECGKRFTNKASLKKHKLMVHDNLRPYVCTVCRKCFGQYNDLTRHQQRHQKDGEGPDPTQDEAPVMPFSCAECSLTFSDVDALQQHVSRDHPEDAELDGGGDNSRDPDFIPQPWVADRVESVLRRPQRRGAGAKISAITKLIAPKRRSNVCTKSESGGLGQTEAEAPAVGNGDKQKRFSCNLCKQTYGNAADLKAHGCTVTPHACSQCSATFKKSGFLKRHEQTVHAEAKSYSCERCQKVFTTPGKLKQHQKMDTCRKYHCTSEFFSCSFCDFSFTMKSYLMKHIRRHHPVQYLSLPASGLADRLEEQEQEPEEEEEHTCPHCGKTYESTKAFKTHACFQQLKVLYLCTDCGKGFSNHYSLRQHQRIHTGEKPHTCPQCSKSFAHSGQLNVHLRTHTGERPYLCTHCGESFRQSGDLKRHERKHTGVRPYSCPECCKSFSRSQSLKAHQMLHQGQRMFKCTQCGKSFSRNYHLRRHHQKMHL